MIRISNQLFYGMLAFCAATFWLYLLGLPLWLVALGVVLTCLWSVLYLFSLIAIHIRSAVRSAMNHECEERDFDRLAETRAAHDSAIQ